MSTRPTVEVSGRTLGGGELFLFAGPCVVESRSLALEIGRRPGAPRHRDEHHPEKRRGLEPPDVGVSGFRFIWG